MAPFPEREVKGGLEERPEEISPLTIERKEVVTPTPSTFTQVVKGNNGKPLIQTPKTADVTIEIPNDQETLTSLAKGKVSDSITWFAAFWLRVIKKALYFGWRLIFKGTK